MKCRECGGIYNKEDKEIILKINHKDIENLEDLIYTILSEKEYIKKRKKFHKIWKQICDGEEIWN